jgi:hypothetical protein
MHTYKVYSPDAAAAIMFRLGTTPTFGWYKTLLGPASELDLEGVHSATQNGFMKGFILATLSRESMSNYRVENISTSMSTIDNNKFVQGVINI